MRATIDAIRTGALDSGCDRGKGHADRTDAMRGQQMRQECRIDGYDDPQTRQTFRQKQGKPDAACARPAGQRTGKRRNHIRPRPGNAYNEKMKGVCDRRLSAFSGRSNSPKTAEPLPDIEA